MRSRMCSKVGQQWRLLVVACDGVDRALLGWHLSGEPGLDLTLADSLTGGLELLSTGRFELLLANLPEPGGNEYSAYERLSSATARRGVPVIWMKSPHGSAAATGTRAIGYTEFLTRPFMPTDLLGRVRIQLSLLAARRELQEQNTRLDHELDVHLKSRLAIDYLGEELSTGARHANIVGISPAVVAIRDQIDCVARTSKPVLIEGEPGTGKEMIARAIHDRSARGDRPFIKLNCTALAIDAKQSGLDVPAEAGTDALGLGQLRRRIELVQGGTLFLNEVSELPPVCQAKVSRLLRVQEHERGRSGGLGRLDARVIATTSRDLRPLVKAGAFRQDLYGRLQGCRIAVPALRDRMEDIPQLLCLFARRAARKAGRRVPEISPELMTQALTYNWPANLIELENCVERALLFSKGTVLGPDPRLVVPRTLAHVLRERIVQALEHTGWTLDGANGAAHLLGIKPGVLRRHMDKLGLRRECLGTASASSVAAFNG